MSNRTKTPQSDKPQKPYPDFPLFPHAIVQRTLNDYKRLRIRIGEDTHGSSFITFIAQYDEP